MIKRCSHDFYWNQDKNLKASRRHYEFVSMVEQGQREILTCQSYIDQQKTGIYGDPCALKRRRESSSPIGSYFKCVDWAFLLF